MYIALETYLNMDHEKEWKLWEDQVNLISDKAKSVDGVEAEIHVPEIANHVPSLRISWDESKVKIKAADVRKALREGHPSIEVKGGEKTVDITTWMMNPGEERIVAERMQDLLKAASA